MIKKIILMVLVLSSFVYADDQIIGDNNLVLVKQDLSNVPLRFKKILPAIGRLSSGCTVTHIGNNMAITAGHCFWQTFYDNLVYQNEDCSTDTVEWMKLDQSQPNLVSQCLKIISTQRDELAGIDYALILLDKAPTVVVPMDFRTSSKRLLGREITLFSYPDESALSWSGFCQISKPDEQHLSKLLTHQCDTLAGSSGAPLIDVKTLKIVGLHISGDTNPFDASAPPPRFNIGHYLSTSPLKNLLKPKTVVLNNM